MQLCVHLGAALRHSRGHVDVVLVRHLDAQLALPGLLGELLDDIGFFSAMEAARWPAHRSGYAAPAAA